jgi:hypothetical protein
LASGLQGIEPGGNGGILEYRNSRTLNYRLKFLHDRLKDGNRLIVDFFIEKRWFYQVAKRWVDLQTGLLGR